MLAHTFVSHEPFVADCLIVGHELLTHTVQIYIIKGKLYDWFRSAPTSATVLKST